MPSIREVTVTNYYVDTEHGEFQTLFRPEDYLGILVERRGNRAVVGYLAHDFDPLNPRKDYDNAGTMLCAHARYQLGDEQFSDANSMIMRIVDAMSEGSPIDYAAVIEDIEDGFVNDYLREHYDPDTADAFAEELINEVVDAAFRQGVVLDLYLYDHSGITMRTGPFNCPWDSGQVGYTFMSPRTIRYERSIPEDKEITADDREWAAAILEAEVDTYDEFIRGNVFGVAIEEHVLQDGAWEWERTNADSVWGCIGDDHAKEALREEFNSAVENTFKENGDG